ncbi:diphosphomevalonate decarboxylase [Aerococcaceae bacterium zg-BR9]|uniref:diphosphomevalonate decarboxylase n=1 Tax=Aerococcaceae bacterium zg-1292 TaxID=2774330 RepID=UPI004063FEEE|nr:diphosphomevalonate decarboxylase [Aerococcaceae bacterium zg-BR9]
MSQGFFRAHTNIALIKYWGKRNTELFLPMTSSLSLTLDAFYTDTKVTLKPDELLDTFFLDGQIQSEEATKNVTQFVDRFRALSGQSAAVQVESWNHVPTAAGLASSASAYAALACACNQAFGLNLDAKALSILARQGSGSASRSLFGGFVEWHKGDGDISESSYAEQIDAANWDIGMLVIVINRKAKKISSRIGMEQTMETSPFYALWPQEVERDLHDIKQAIQAQDIDSVGQIAEHNAMKMHATTLAANPSFTYWEPDSLRAIQIIQTMREDLGFQCYITMDAGPNVKVLCPASQLDALRGQLLSHFAAEQLITALPGPAPYVLPLNTETNG